jgi:excisionase family DNA binding protein
MPLFLWLLLLRAVPAGDLPDTSLLLTVIETGERLRVSRRMVTNLLQAGELDSVRIGRRRLVLARSVDAYIERHTEGGS